MTNSTLAQAFEKIVGGEPAEWALLEFVDAFFQESSNEARFALIAEAPRPTGRRHLDALAGAMGEYMAKHFCLPRIPAWIGEPSRYLDHPWHVMIFNDGRERPALSSDEGLREFLTFSSPAEFKSRCIFTDATPLPPRYYGRLSAEAPSE